MTNANTSSLSAPSSLALIPEMITSPGTALDKIWKFGAPWWLPYLIIITMTVLVYVMYYAQLDYEWFISYSTSELSGDEQAQTIEGMRKMSTNMLMAISVVGIAVVLTVVYLAYALYLMIVNRVSGTTERSFQQWLTITTWTALPAVFLALGCFLHLLISTTGEIPPESLSPTNLNTLIFHATKTDTLYNFYNTLDLISLWGTVLLMLALYKNGQGKVASVIIALLPQVIISGIALI